MSFCVLLLPLLPLLLSSLLLVVCGRGLGLSYCDAVFFFVVALLLLVFGGMVMLGTSLVIGCNSDLKNGGWVAVMKVNMGEVLVWCLKTYIYLLEQIILQQ